MTDLVTDEARLFHLADRVRRGVILPAEGEQLADVVQAMTRRVTELTAERDQYAAAIKQLILQVKWTAHIWATTLPDTIPTADVTRALSFLCSPVPLPDDLRDDLWQQISAAYYVRFENDGHPEDATAAADVAMSVVRPELEQLEQLEQRITELVAGQCVHSRHACEQHHRLPVDGCPYPRCIAARRCAGTKTTEA
ncbi:hypothetical protein C5F59_027630 [Streptomyces sp. QL37]|uniref:hypothetical protein n=1 Tax=Streptomyces sp. QL37 TaxID=2093747 RepID=UPI000CF28470|nr:hypothetical protein [Streptomyces sp. QL37]PPQ57117.1 hypothetical protein C5F59_10810 [Streptomyces sp. QL37]